MHLFYECPVPALLGRCHITNARFGARRKGARVCRLPMDVSEKNISAGNSASGPLSFPREITHHLARDNRPPGIEECARADSGVRCGPVHTEILAKWRPGAEHCKPGHV